MVLKVSDKSPFAFAYGAFTLYGRPFQSRSANDQICNSVGVLQRPRRALQPPILQRLAVYHTEGLGSSPFARHYSGNDFFSSGYLDVSVPPVPPIWPIDSAVVTGYCPGRVSPFGYPRINAC